MSAKTRYVRFAKQEGLKNPEGLWEALRKAALKGSPEGYLGVIQGRAAGLQSCATPGGTFHTELWKCGRKWPRTWVGKCGGVE